MSRGPRYPFVPKSTAFLEPGQFWSIPLTSGRFAAGRVLQLEIRPGLRNARLFHGGLMDWSGPALPTTADLAGRRLRAEGSMHVRAISRNGGQVIGHRLLSLDAIEPGLFLDRSPDDPGCQVQRGMEVIGVASPEQRSTLPALSTWGYGVVVLLAEKFFVLGESSIHS